MVNTLIGFSGAATAIASLGMIAFFVALFLKKIQVTGPGEAAGFLKLFALARNASMMFMVLGWAVASCMPWEDCLREYGVLGARCREIGEDWFLAGLVLLVGAMVLKITDRQPAESAVLHKIPASAFTAGLLFWGFSVLLTGL